MRTTDSVMTKGKLRDCLYDAERREFVVIFQDGRMYRVRRDWFTEDDGTKILRVRVGPDGAAFIVEQASGNRLEVPWDLVLYHSDPTYQYYKGKKVQQELERDAASRIGKRIREVREAKGLTAHELARRSGVLRPNVSRLEGGKHVPTIDTLERIAQALHVSLVDLLPPQQVREGLPARGVLLAEVRAKSNARRRARRKRTTVSGGASARKRR